MERNREREKYQLHAGHYVYSAAPVMSDWISILFSSDFTARGTCGNWHPNFVYLYVISNLLITAAYLALGLALLNNATHPAKGRVSITRNQAFRSRLVFGLFILVCGIGHSEGAMSFIRPYYHLFAAWHLAAEADHCRERRSDAVDID